MPLVKIKREVSLEDHLQIPLEVIISAIPIWGHLLRSHIWVT